MEGDDISLLACKIIFIFVLVSFGGLITGLTLGLMSLDKLNLQILVNSGDGQQQKWAKKIQPIRKQGHLLLVTLLLTSTLTFETLPILMEPILGGGTFAIISSTVLTLIFGEVVPQAICARHGLRIGAMFSWVVQLLIWILYIVAYPIASLLDWILGEHGGVIYRRSELKELMAIHGVIRGGSLSNDEVTIISGALDLSEKCAANIMTSRRHVVMLDINSNLDWVTLRDIQRAGHSRIPIYENDRDNIVGLILVKSLILIDPNASTPVRNVKTFPIPKVKANTSLFDLLNKFQEGTSHMAVVMEFDTENPKPVGIVTLEDVIEELIQEEIVDETDVYVDVPKRIKAIRKASDVLRRARSPVVPQFLLANCRISNQGPEFYRTFSGTNTPLRIKVDNVDEQTPLFNSTKSPSIPPLSARRLKLFTSPKPPQVTTHQLSNGDGLSRFKSHNPRDSVHLRPGTEDDLNRIEEERDGGSPALSEFKIGSY